MAKYIMVCGGCHSGSGKGIASASIGLLLSMRGLKVVPIKFDPYFNTNAGVLSPREHGEVFLCSDGTEADLDLGTYERIIGIEVSGNNILTSGKLYKDLLQDEENGKYLGQTVQIIPHVTNLIQQRLTDLGKNADVVIVEIGGTVGDLESGPYLEAIRQFKQKNYNDVVIMLVSPILWVPTTKEFKTKPLQASVKTLQSFGIQPEILLCRTDRKVSEKLLDKISNLTNVPRESIFDAPDVKSIYQVPIEFYNRHIDDFIADKLHLRRSGCKIHKYRELVEKYISSDLPNINIAIVGKYDNCDEAYVSLKEALYHAGVANDVKVNIKWIAAEDLEGEKDLRELWKKFEDIDGLIVPGGFDVRGIEGKIRAIKYVREKQIPFLGICLGLQCAVIEICRNLLDIEDATSEEFDSKSNNKVIHFVEGQQNITKKSGTMRLGAYDCLLSKDSIIYNLYNKDIISERHRHRYEVNSLYIDRLKEVGFKVVGVEPKTKLVEMMELKKEIHPFFVGVQFHPEFKSKLSTPAPLFFGLVEAAKNNYISKNKIET